MTNSVWKSRCLISTLRLCSAVDLTVDRLSGISFAKLQPAPSSSSSSHRRAAIPPSPSANIEEECSGCGECGTRTLLCELARGGVSMSEAWHAQISGQFIQPTKELQWTWDSFSPSLIYRTPLNNFSRYAPKFINAILNCIHHVRIPRDRRTLKY